jgi:hypothetical protein
VCIYKCECICMHVCEHLRMYCFFVSNQLDLFLEKKIYLIYLHIKSLTYFDRWISSSQGNVSFPL